MAESKTDDLNAEVVRDLQNYNAAFVRANHEDDASLMRPWMRLPVMRFGNGSVHAIATAEELDATYQRMVDGLKGTGYRQSILSDFEVDMLNPTTALVRCHAVREKADGTVLESFEAAYIMARGDEHWQVACLIGRR